MERKKIEILIDRSIPYALILLLFIIIGEVFFHDELAPYHLWVSLIDGLIITTFVVDLCFKYNRLRNAKVFFRKYWLEVIAVFPAFLFVRIVEEIALLTTLDDAVLLGQDALEIESRTQRSTRLRYFQRYVRALARLPRFLKAFKFYDKPI